MHKSFPHKQSYSDYTYEKHTSIWKDIPKEKKKDPNRDKDFEERLSYILIFI